MVEICRHYIVLSILSSCLIRDFMGLMLLFCSEFTKSNFDLLKDCVHCGNPTGNIIKLASLMEFYAVTACISGAGDSNVDSTDN